MIFLLISCYILKTNNKSIKTENIFLKNQKQEAENLLIRINEDLNKLKDENFELRMSKEQLDKINNSENYHLYKKELQKYIEENINDLIGTKPASGGLWIVTQTKFINPFEIIIYYEDGHESMESKAAVTLQGNKIKIIGRKNP